MTTIYFIRHADSDRKHQDDRSRPLSPKGLNDRSLVTEFLKDKEIDIILSSPYRRAIDTIKPFADSIDKMIQTDESYREREIGTWVEDIAEFIKNQWSDFSYKLSVPNSESLSEAQLRNIMAINAVLEQHKDKNIVIATHGNLLGSIINFFDKSFDYKKFRVVCSLMPWIVKMEFDGHDFISYESIDPFRHSNEHTDIAIKKPNESFYYSVRGVIEQDGKYLIMQVNEIDMQSSWHFPGGHVEIGEEAESAIKREILEEVGCNIKEVKLFCILENFWKHEGTICHGLELFFLAKPDKSLKTENYFDTEIDKGKEKKLEFRWLTSEQIKDFDVRPRIIKDLIINGDLKKVHHLVQRPNL